MYLCMCIKKYSGDKASEAEKTLYHRSRFDNNMYLQHSMVYEFFVVSHRCIEPTVNPERA